MYAFHDINGQLTDIAGFFKIKYKPVYILHMRQHFLILKITQMFTFRHRFYKKLICMSSMCLAIVETLLRMPDIGVVDPKHILANRLQILIPTLH
jgi:hypothetical protein